MIYSFEEFQDFQPARPTYGLFGWPLGHTMSPELHAQLFHAAHVDADYIAVAVPPEQLGQAMALARQKLLGINLTIPHKKAVIRLLDAVDQSALDLHSVNTVHFKNGEAIGYNTDIFGFAATLEKDGVELRGRKVVLLGYGGAAAVMAYHCVHSGAHLFITGRNPEKAQALRAQLLSSVPHAKIETCTRRHIPRDAQIVINGTPLGMFPLEEKKPLYFLPRKTEYVFDAIYNPPVTSTMRLATNKKTRTRNGLHMLVMQAAAAQTIWNGTQFDPPVCDGICRRVLAKMAVKRLHEKHGKQNLVLCGFMGSGKTTVGRKLSRLTGLTHIDADNYLEEKEGHKISEIFETQGEQAFRDLETRYLREICAMDGVVVSLGGGAVLRPENVQIIKETGFLIHLDTPFFRIVKNLSGSTHRPLLDNSGDKLAETRRLYNTRKNIYRRAADQSVRSPRLSELIDRLLQSI